MSINTEDAKRPVEALQEAAETLKRQADALSDPETAKRRILLTEALQATADDLKELAEGLEWLGLRWVPAPLKRTADALMKLTPADVAEGEEALKVPADALKAAANAAKNTPLPDDGMVKLEIVRMGLGMSHKSVLDSIAESLEKTAEGVRQASSADDLETARDLQNASTYLKEMTWAIAKAKELPRR